ncbi:MAG: BLUF domain-containing protein [Burkholderiaceae bacterium]
MLLQLFYVSQTEGALTDVELQVLLGQAQIRNRRLDVTGILVKGDGHFCQVLEGRPKAVEQVMERVRRDPRHRNVRVLWEQVITRREFGQWAMGLTVRSDLADEMDRLHRLGGLGGTPMREVIRRLTEPRPEAGGSG